MRYLILSLLVGCAYGVEDPLPLEEAQNIQAPTPRYSPNEESQDTDQGACGRRRQTITFDLPDGGHSVTISLPVECDPFWIDRGDPPPFMGQ